MKYIIYKVTCTINGMIYIGYHSTDDINDNYLGSGKYLLSAIKKYGCKKFKKEILHIFENKEDALLKEAEIVNHQFVRRKDTYNLKIGGEGGWDYINNEIAKDIDHMIKKYEKVSVTLKELYRNKKLIGWKINHMDNIPNGMKGKKHSQESKEKMSSNSINKLSHSEIINRINDIQEENNKWGYITRLSKKWEVSHTQVKRFIKKYLET